MKKIQSVLCAAALAISLSSTVLAGNIHGVSANGNIHGVSANGNIHGIYGILVSDLLVSIFGNIHG
ncbi:MAG: hypothetical protein ND866_14200 [Pyrinomonadaceae bacterium]|nr:hypothetical protein [Pyrinomonadaceae bacterium]